MNSTQTTLVDLEKNDIHQSTPVNVEGCIGRFDSLRTNVGSEESRTNTHTPLEGGMKGWSTVAGGCCLTFVTTGLCGAFGVYQDYYARFYLTEYPPSQIGWIGSVQFCLVFFISMPAGLLFDAGYFHWVVGLASMTYVLALGLLSSAKSQEFWRIFVTHGVLAGISLGFLFLPPVAVLSHHFKRHHTLAVGIITSSSSCGATVFPWLLK
ncbi:hypothetical protein CPB86DRAFT_512469 [Serendipita vermifera]|nr:hypothetical protein CPB86DRAFT_512469 [Serendipita vermifera]